jgi:hypothetical protein
MAEDEEDDESFGDFKFASSPNQQFPSTSVQNNGWNGTNSTKPFDPFTVSPDPLAKRVNDTNGGVSVQANKARGAIPLSIFGEEEDEEPVSGSRDFFSSNGGVVVKNGSDLNGGGVGISDFISNLYYQQPQVSSVNGSVSMSNVDPSNRSVDGATKLNANAKDLNRDENEDDDGWVFLCCSMMMMMINKTHRRRRRRREIVSESLRFCLFFVPKKKIVKRRVFQSFQYKI